MRILIIFITFTITTAFAQLHAPYNTQQDQGLLRGYLEKDFEKLLGDCKLTPLSTAKLDKDKVKSGQVISTVPVTLQSELQWFDAPVYAPSDRSPASFFSLIFIPEERPKGKTPFFDSKRMLPADYTQDPVTLLPKGASSIFYNHTCSSVLNAALNINAGVTFPIATLSGAIQDQYGANRQGALSLVEGHFNSPLDDYFGISADSVHKTYGNFLLWLWYVRNNDRANALNSYLASFDGIALYRLSTDKQNNDGSVSLSAKINAGVVTSEDAVKYSISTSNMAKVESYETFLYTDVSPTAEWGHFEPIPNAAGVAQALWNPPFIVDSYDQEVTQSNQPYKITEHLDGVPISMCQNGDWMPADLNINSNYILSMGPVTKTDLPNDINKRVTAPTGCQFTVFFTANPAFINNGQNVAIKLALVHKGAAGLPRLQLQAHPVLVAPLISPEVHLSGELDPSPKNVAGTDNQNRPTAILTWVAKFLINDKNDKVDVTVPVDTSDSQQHNNAVSVQCPNLPSPRFDVVADYQNTASSPKELRLVLTKTIYSGDKEDMSATPVECSVTGALGFTMLTSGPGNQPRVNYRPIPQNFIIRYPPPKISTPGNQTTSPLPPPPPPPPR